MEDVELLRLLQRDHGCWNHAGPDSGVCRACKRRAALVSEHFDSRMSAIKNLLDQWRSLPVWGPDDRGLMILDDVDLDGLLNELTEAIYGPDPNKKPRVSRGKRRESSDDA